MLTLFRYVKSLEQRVVELEQLNQQIQASPGGPQLAQGLGVLSLQASSEGRYLGPASGVSFAQFTQSIICKLDTRKEISGNGVILSTSAESSFPPVSDRLLLPNPERASELANFYWLHSHTLYPFVDKANISRLFEAARVEGSGKFEDKVKDPELLFHLYMVMAIGSTAMASITVSSEDEASYCLSLAMAYFDEVLSLGSRVALEAILLLISYSFFNRLGPDTWYLVGIASRLAIGLGLHAAKSVENLPFSEQNHLKKVFWSLYMMDRVVSTTLGRPLAIRDQDISISLFQSDANEDLDVTLHILSLRKIAGEILEEVYTPIESCDEEICVLNDIHSRLVQWRRGMPFPLNESQYPLIPHFTTAWFDLNYYNLEMMLYRPSPLVPSLSEESLKIIANASSMAIQQFSHMHRQNKLSFNWLNLVSVFSATLTIVFVTNQFNWQRNYIDKDVVIEQLKLAEQLLQKFSTKHPPAKECLKIVKGVIEDLKKAENDDKEYDYFREFTQPPIVDSTMSMLSMGSDTYYEDLISQIDLSFLSELDTIF